MEDVVSVFGSEAREDDASGIGLEVSVGIAQVQQLCRVGDIAAIVAGSDSGGDQQSAGKDGGLVGSAVSVGVFDDQDAIVGDLAGFDLGVGF